MTASERNAHYGRLNQRFDERASYLRKSGYRYEHIPGIDVAIFINDIPRNGKPHVITASKVQCADEVVWADECQSVRLRAN